jgi:hypothetical protein
MKRRHGAGGFGIEILSPGHARGDLDSALSVSGRIDRARVTQGDQPPFGDPSGMLMA